MTRVAAGHPGIWPDICAANCEAIVVTLDGPHRGADRRCATGSHRATGGGCWRSCERPPSPADRFRRRRCGRNALRSCGSRCLTARVCLAEITTLAGTLSVSNISDLEIAHSAEGERGVARPRRRCGLCAGPPRGPRGPGLPVHGTEPRVIGDFADELEVLGGRELRGTVTVPGDKSISHRALIFGTLAEGTSRVRGLSDGEDVGRTLRIMEDLGARISDVGDPASRNRGSGSKGNPEIRRPPGPLDCGNSGTTMRLLAGVVAGRGWPVRMEGDQSLSGRPMDRIAEPLRMMGAEVDGRSERCLPPILLAGEGLRGIEFSPRQASAQVKSCILLAGLHASGETVVREPVATRRHTEDFLELCGADFEEVFEEEPPARPT